MEPPLTRYAKNRDVRIAYQVVDSGPLDLVFVPGFISNIELFWEQPESLQPRCPLDRQGAAWPMAHADLSGGTALRPHHRALRHRRPDQRPQLSRLSRAVPGANPQRRRCRHHGQSRQSQGQGSASPDPQRRRQAVLPAPLLPRSQSDRAGLCQTQTLLRKTDPRTIEATWRSIGQLLDRFTPKECANYLAN